MRGFILILIFIHTIVPDLNAWSRLYYWWHCCGNLGPCPPLCAICRQQLLQGAHCRVWYITHPYHDPLGWGNAQSKHPSIVLCPWFYWICLPHACLPYPSRRRLEWYGIVWCGMVWYEKLIVLVPLPHFIPQYLRMQFLLYLGYSVLYISILLAVLIHIRRLMILAQISEYIADPETFNFNRVSQVLIQILSMDYVHCDVKVYFCFLMHIWSVSSLAKSTFVTTLHFDENPSLA